MNNLVPALLGSKRSMGAPSIGLRRHRPLAAPRGANLKRGALLLAALALTGCATTRYVPTYCLTHDQALPAEPPRIKDKLTGQADKDLEIVAGSAIRLRAYGEGLQTILEGCRDPNAH